MEVEGLCLGGGVDPRVNEVGYLVLIRKSSPGEATSPEYRNFEHYRKLVRDPFIKQT